MTTPMKILQNYYSYFRFFLFALDKLFGRAHGLLKIYLTHIVWLSRLWSKYK